MEYTQCMKTPLMGAMHRRRRIPVLMLAAFSLGACLLPNGAAMPPPPVFYSFVLPWNDSAPAAFDLSSWNGGPIGPADESRRMIVGADGHYAAGGKRIRLLGVNFSSLPSPEDSRAIARRMAKFGVNFVRLHALDAPWVPRNLFARTAGERMVDPDPAMLGRLDALVAAFADAGIYVEITLLTGREFSSADDLPRELDRIGDFKARHANGFFYPPILTLQESWARDLLDRTNSVRHVRFADDPAVAMVEINNENGLVHAWLGGQLDGLPDVLVHGLAVRWNALLKSRYGSHDLFVKSLGLVVPSGRTIVSANSAAGWKEDFNGPAHGSVSYRSDSAAGPVAQINVTSIGDEGWNAQLSRAGFAVRAGEEYTLSFAARSDTPRKAVIALAMAHDPWSPLGLWKTIDLGTGWRRFQFLVSPTGSDARARLLVGDLGLATGRVEIASTLFREGGVSLDPRENLDAGTIAVPRSDTASSPAYLAAWLSFLYDVDREYWNGMYGFLKKDLGVKSVVIGTSVFTATPLEMAALDGLDTHTYWRHPEFPAAAWDSTNWFIRNDAMVRSPSGGDIGEAAVARVAGKPFVVSEFSEPAPNSFSAEQLPLAAAYASYQDWDGLLMFTYSPAGPGADDWGSGRLADYFDVANNPLSWPYFIAAACVFRRADVAPARQWRFGALSEDSERSALPFASAWNLRLQDVSGLLPADVLREGIAVRMGGSISPRSPAASGAEPPVSDTGELAWDSKNGLFTENTTRSKAVVGFFLDVAVRLGVFSLRLDRSTLGFASATFSAITGDLGAKHSTSLLTIAATARNTGMGLFDYRTKRPLGVPPEGVKVSSSPSFGQGPVMVEGIAATATLRVGAGVTRVTVSALDPRGRQARSVPVLLKDGIAAFSVSERYETIWYLVTID